MLEINNETIASAAARAREHQSQGRRVRVARLSDSEMAVSCVSGEHPRGHIARFERKRDGALFGECVLRDTGELCPSALGRHVCFHLAAGVTLFVALEDRDALVEHAVQFDGPLPRFECRRATRVPEPEGDPEAVLVAPPVVKRGKREYVRGFQI